MEDNTLIKLRDLRKSAGLTQADLASILGVERSTYVKYERGSSDPPTATLIRLANYFHVSLDELLGHAVPTERPQEAAPVSAPTDTDTELLRKYHALDERGQQLIQTMLEHEYEQAQKEKASITSPA